MGHLDAKVSEEICGHVVAGFVDALPALRDATVKSMALLAPKLSAKTLNNTVMKHMTEALVRGRDEGGAHADPSAGRPGDVGAHQRDHLHRQDCTVPV